MISIALYRNVHHDSAECGCAEEVDLEKKENSHSQSRDRAREWKYRYLYIAPSPSTRLCKRDQVMVIYAINNNPNQPRLDTLNSLSTL